MPTGEPTAWLHRTVFPPIESTFQPDVTYGSAGELQQGVTDMPYAIPNVRCENGPAANHVRIGWYRSVFNIPHAFAVCSFADELAAAAGQDPLEYLRALLGAPRISICGRWASTIRTTAPRLDVYYRSIPAACAASSIWSPRTAAGARNCRQARPRHRGASQLSDLCRGGGAGRGRQ